MREVIALAAFAVIFICLGGWLYIADDSHCEQLEIRAQAFEKCKRHRDCMANAAEWEAYLSTLQELEKCND